MRPVGANANADAHADASDSDANTNTDANADANSEPTPTPTPGACLPENFDGVTAPALPANWVATNIVKGNGIRFVTSTIVLIARPIP